MISDEQMLFYALGQLTERSKGEGYEIVYRKRAPYPDQLSELIPCRDCMYTKTKPSQGEDIVECRAMAFTLVVCKEWFGIALFVGTCKVCGIHHVLHEIESLKDTFRRNNAQTAQDHD